MSHGSSEVARIASALEGEKGLSVASDDTSREAHSTDFGGIVRRVPAAIVRPTCDEDVLSVLALAKRHGFSVATRGAGHSQSGQGLSGGGALIDMRGMNRVLAIDEKAHLVTAEGGATWRQVIDRAKACRLLPLGLTHVCEPTVAGTLSVAGVGAEAFRVGAQVNNVVALDVATMDGRVVRCSATEERELFDAVRSGLGQCGVVLRAHYPLRPSKACVRIVYLIYDDPSAFVADIERVASDLRADYVSAMIVPDEAAPAGFSLVLMLGKEHEEGETASEEALRDGLCHVREQPSQSTPVWTEDAAPGHVFFRRYDAPSGEKPLHPWVDHLFCREDAVSVLTTLLEGRVMPLRMGTNLLLIIRRTGTPAPLFALPEGEGLVLGLGLFPAFSPSMRDFATMMMADYADTFCRAGGKRYLSGYLEPRSEADWNAHYGGAWGYFCRLKRRFDPGNRLQPGLFPWA